eukprot:Protomagalhaensia_wolfi_Nauph_80__2476@NODE_2645_length_1030_cov_2_481332_g2072_i0_p1_GENE_NODE_2645_length_1030_cov_2_481332_g2072_i0NODE_2645_length_1030_cov_2_481332_g2072_i0_p1_ORF_typecomplete_len240_score27_01DUF4217/PF13959_6/9_8e12_NODE_2645_length_1030_cov_2_481332_g2072_i0262981
MGAPGSSVIFLLDHEAGYVDELRRNNVCPHGITERPQSAVLQAFAPATATKKRGVTSYLPDTLRCLREKDCINFLTSRFTMFVGDNKHLLNLGCRAYQAYVKGYRSYPRELWTYFNIDQLHLGHVAGSFFLRGSPNEIAKQLGEDALPGVRPRSGPPRSGGSTRDRHRQGGNRDNYRQGGDSRREGFNRGESERGSNHREGRRPWQRDGGKENGRGGRFGGRGRAEGAGVKHFSKRGRS